MDVQERKIERDFGFPVMNFSCNEILKFISKVDLLIMASLFFRLLPSFLLAFNSLFLQIVEHLELLEHFENFREVEKLRTFRA
jgi:hypothetical protein